MIIPSLTEIKLAPLLKINLFDFLSFKFDLSFLKCRIFLKIKIKRNYLTCQDF